MIETVQILLQYSNEYLFKFHYVSFKSIVDRFIYLLDYICNFFSSHFINIFVKMRDRTSLKNDKLLELVYSKSLSHYQHSEEVEVV